MPDTSMLEKMRYIRFIDSDYKTLFFLPNGGRIRITYPNGRQFDRVCRFIDVCHMTVDGHSYHIREFAEHMERNRARYEPLDYIRDLKFYDKYFFMATEKSSGPAYYIIDETETHAFAVTPNGSPKEQKYCIVEWKKEGDSVFARQPRVVDCSSSLKEIRPQDWGFNLAKIKGITQKRKSLPGHKR